MNPPPPSPLERLGAELKRLRDDAGRKQEDAAVRADINRATLSKIENGHACPHVATLDALLNLYQVPDAARVELRALREAASALQRTP